jgi:peptide/nickel transport system substrate-binding protein
VATGPGEPFLSSKVEADAAESFEIPDPLTVTVKLKPNLQFGDPINRAMTADDVVFSFDRFVGNIEGVDVSPEAGSVLEIFESWTKLDDTTVQFKLNRPQARIDYRMGSTYTPYIMPVDADNLYNVDTLAVGTGPWLLKGAVQDVSMLFEGNPRSHIAPERPYVESVELITQGDYTNRLTQFLGGNIDNLTGIGGGDLERIINTVDDVQFLLFQRGDPVPMNGLAFSAESAGRADAPWRDPRVRQAVSMAMNRDDMTEAAYDFSKLKELDPSIELEWNGFLPAAMKEFWANPRGDGRGIHQLAAGKEKFFQQDLEGARNLLKEAGFEDGFDAPLHYVTIFGPGHGTLAELLQGYLSQIGINLELSVADYRGVYVPEIRNKGNFDGLAQLFYGVFQDPGEFFGAMYLPTGNRNNSRVEDPILNGMINDVESELDNESRTAKVVDVQNYLADQMYYVPIQAGAAPVAVANSGRMRNVLDYVSWDAGKDETYYWIDEA